MMKYACWVKPASRRRTRGSTQTRTFSLHSKEEETGRREGRETV